MVIYPAIDIYEGKVVRLKRGDYEQMTVYSDNPVSIASEFKKTGAGHIHIVDLEGARAGTPANAAIIQKIAVETGLFVQVGGGIRNASSVKMYLDAGIKRVILGTVAVSEPGFLRDMVQKYGSAIAAGADIKEGFIAIRGWTELSDRTVLSFCRGVEDVGISTIICTDVSKDGMQAGTNIELYNTLRSELPNADIIASGGVSSIKELEILKSSGISGVIIGKALYEGDINLADALLSQ